MMKNKKGFMTVYICLFFTTLVFLIGIFTSAVKESSVQSGAEALSRLWAQSILAEYDLNLQQRYHVFGFYGHPEDIKSKLTFYGEESYGSPSSKGWEISNCSLYAYSLRNTSVFKTQMIEAGKLALTDKFIKPEPNIRSVSNLKQVKADELFQHLPSEGCKSNFFLDSMESLLGQKWSVKELISKGCERYFETKYILSHFNDYSREDKFKESYFTQEAEYIICGNKTDEANQRGVKRRIIAIREVLNLLYLNENDRTRNEALAVAEVLTPGAAAIVTQQTILALWAYAESVNDYQLLVEGHQVPMKKTSQTWAIDLDSALSNTSEGYIYTGIDEGDSYLDYLQLMLYMMDENILILRTMDLIQMNMRCFYYDGFFLQDYNGGLQFTVNVNNVPHEVKMCYDKKT